MPSSRQVPDATTITITTTHSAAAATAEACGWWWWLLLLLLMAVAVVGMNMSLHAAPSLVNHQRPSFLPRPPRQPRPPPADHQQRGRSLMLLVVVIVAEVVADAGCVGGKKHMSRRFSGFLGYHETVDSTKIRNRPDKINVGAAVPSWANGSSVRVCGYFYSCCCSCFNHV